MKLNVPVLILVLAGFFLGRLLGAQDATLTLSLQAQPPLSWESGCCLIAGIGVDANDQLTHGYGWSFDQIMIDFVTHRVHGLCPDEPKRPGFKIEGGISTK